MSVGWSYEQVIKLLKLYKSRDMLWDPQSPDYKNRALKKEAWESIAEALEMTRLQVEPKIHNLRTQYARERRKLRKHIAEHGETYEPHWFAYKHLLFLKGLELEEAVRRNSNSEIQYISEGQIWDPLENESSSDQPETSNEFTIDDLRPAKKSKTVEEEVLTTLYPNMLQYPTHSKQCKNIKDDFSIFGEYIACELRSVKEEHAQAVAKHHINNIIFDAQMGKYNRIQPKRHSVPNNGQNTAEASPLGRDSTEDLNEVKLEAMNHNRNIS